LRGQHRPPGLQVDALPALRLSEVLGAEKLSGQAAEHKDEAVMLACMITWRPLSVVDRGD
jgi:hypothetical protein